MTTIHICLPDELAQDARDLGLLDPDAMAELLQNEIRRRAFSDIFAISHKLADDNADASPEPARPQRRRR